MDHAGTSTIVDSSARDASSHLEHPEGDIQPVPAGQRGLTFWMVFISTLLVDMLSAIDLTAVSTALPTIVDRLHGADFIWAGGAYTIASTAILPLVGGLVEGFGRKRVLLVFVFAFCVGSILCGAAVSMRMLVAGRGTHTGHEIFPIYPSDLGMRTGCGILCCWCCQPSCDESDNESTAIQGLGSGGSMSVTDIIFADMVPLPERGKFQGIAAAVWALACSVGPPIGGALASSGQWRWLFFLNLPLCAVATFFICIFLHSHVPTTSVKSKLVTMDWTGIVIIIAGTVLVLLALTWGGQHFPWVSVQVLVPLIVGALGIVLFFVIEKVWLKGPTIPEFVFTNRTVLSGYLGTFFHGVVSLSVVYYLPVYIQASKETSAIHSGVDMLGLSFTIPAFAIFTGISVEIFSKYRPQNYIGWVFTIVGFGLLTMLDRKSSAKRYIGFQIPLGVGLGILWISPQFPILAPLPYSNSAYALSFWIFVRNFAQSWGIVVGGAILQNVLSARLPQSFLDTLPRHQEFAYSIIPHIHHLQQPLRDQVRSAFADGTRVIWWVMVGMSTAGFCTCLLMREEEIKTSMDQTWALQEKANKSTRHSDEHENPGLNP